MILTSTIISSKGDKEMKKFVVLLLLVLCIPLTIFANDNRNIVGISKNMEFTIGIDTNSINVIRYDPPYYIISVDEYHQNFSKGLLGARKAQYFYNYKTREMETKTLKQYTSDGSSNFTEDEYYNTDLRPVREGTMAYLIGNYVFYKAYGMYFSKELQDQYGNRDVLKK